MLQGHETTTTNQPIVQYSIVIHQGIHNTIINSHLARFCFGDYGNGGCFVSETRWISCRLCTLLRATYQVTRRVGLNENEAILLVSFPELKRKEHHLPTILPFHSVSWSWHWAYLSTYLLISLPTYLSTYLPTYLYIYLPTYLSIYLPIYLPT